MTAGSSDPTPLETHASTATGTLLRDAQATTMLPVRDLDRACRFYGQVLGLNAVGARADGKFLYRCGNGALIALFPKPEGTRAEHTAVSFEVDSLETTMQQLKSRGVAFHDYDFPGLRTVGQVCVLGSEKAAWFSDTEGNLLCVHEEIAA